MGHLIEIEFVKTVKITHQTVFAVSLQSGVDAEVNSLLEAGHIKRFDKILDGMFIQPVVVTVKRDRNVKIALDARSLNNAILKK